MSGIRIGEAIRLDDDDLDEGRLSGDPARAEAWHDVHPLIHGDCGWFAGRKNPPVLPGTLIHVTVER